MGDWSEFLWLEMDCLFICCLSQCVCLCSAARSLTVVVVLFSFVCVCVPMPITLRFFFHLRWFALFAVAAFVVVGTHTHFSAIVAWCDGPSPSPRLLFKATERLCVRFLPVVLFLRVCIDCGELPARFISERTTNNTAGRFHGRHKKSIQWVRECSVGVVVDVLLLSSSLSFQCARSVGGKKNLWWMYCGQLNSGLTEEYLHNKMMDFVKWEEGHICTMGKRGRKWEITLHKRREWMAHNAKNELLLQNLFVCLFNYKKVWFFHGFVSGKGRRVLLLFCFADLLIIHWMYCCCCFVLLHANYIKIQMITNDENRLIKHVDGLIDVDCSYGFPRYIPTLFSFGTFWWMDWSARRAQQHKK